MKVILSKYIHGLGEEGDVVDITNGYARNYLIPSGKVVEYNNQNISILKSRAKAIQKRKEEKHLQQMSLRERVEGKTFTIPIKTNDRGHLYGAINQTIVVEALAKEGIEMDKRQLLVPEHTLKSVGSYTLVAKLSQNLSANFSIDVVSENYPNAGYTSKENSIDTRSDDIRSGESTQVSTGETPSVSQESYTHMNGETQTHDTSSLRESDHDNKDSSIHSV